MIIAQPAAAGAEPAAAAPPRRRGPMDRFIDGIELIAAIFVGLVALIIFTSVLLRYFFAASIPDAYDLGKYLLGILICICVNSHDCPVFTYPMIGSDV